MAAPPSAGSGVCSDNWSVGRGCQNGDERRRKLPRVALLVSSCWAKGSIAFVARGSLFDVTAPPLTGLQAAHQSTLELVSARIELVRDRGWEMPSMPNQRRGGLLRPLLKGTNGRQSNC
jgi:hypothetical protein